MFFLYFPQVTGFYQSYFLLVARERLLSTSWCYISSRSFNISSILLLRRLSSASLMEYTLTLTTYNCRVEFFAINAQFFHFLLSALSVSFSCLSGEPCFYSNFCRPTKVYKICQLRSYKLLGLVILSLLIFYFQFFSLYLKVGNGALYLNVTCPCLCLTSYCSGEVQRCTSSHWVDVARWGDELL